MCCNNGAVIVHFKSKEIEYETTPVDTQTITNLINEAKPYLMGGYCIDQYDHHFFGLQEIPPFIIRYYNPKSSIFCSVEKAILPSKVSYTFYIKEGKLEEAKKVFDKEEYSSLRRIYWGINDEEPSSVNFASKKANKATAIKRMQEIYSIDDEHVIAFGDSYNDIDMLNYAHYGIYMCNGRKSMIKDAKYITKKDNNHNGIVDYLKKNFKL